MNVMYNFKTSFMYLSKVYMMELVTMLHPSQKIQSMTGRIVTEIIIMIIMIETESTVTETGTGAKIMERRNPTLKNLLRR